MRRSSSTGLKSAGFSMSKRSNLIITSLTSRESSAPLSETTSLQRQKRVGSIKEAKVCTTR